MEGDDDGPEGQADDGGVRTTKRAIERTVIDTNPVTTQTDFDMLGRRLQLTDTRGNVWTWTYDSLDRPRVQVDPDSGRREFTYDDVARTQTETDARGFTLIVSYDTFGRIESKATAEGTATFWYGQDGTWKNWGRLTTVVSPDPDEVLDARDGLRRRRPGGAAEERDTLGGLHRPVARQFDAAGRVTSLTYPDTTSIGPFEYDEAGRLTTITGILSSVTYDAAGRPLVQTNANGTVTNGPTTRIAELLTALLPPAPLCRCRCRTSLTSTIPTFRS